MARTLYGTTHAVLALTSAVRTNGAANGVAVDLGANGNDFQTVAFAIATGTITDGSHAVSVQDSADGSTGWANVDPGRIQGNLPTIVAADDDKAFYFGLAVGAKQYVRIVVTTSGATTGGAFSAVAVLGNASQSPPVRS